MPGRADVASGVSVLFTVRPLLLRPGEYCFKEDSMKRSLIFGLIAVLSAGLVFVGCDNGTTSNEPSTVVTPDGVVIDHTANTAAGLKTDLMDTNHPDWQVIAFDISGAATSFADSTTIPAGKTVVLVNSGGEKTISVGTGGLIIEGKLIVSNNTGVSATTANKIFVGGAGSVEVQKGGGLVVDDQKSVSNYVVNSTAVDSVLTKRVSFAGGSSLVIDKEVFATVDEIGTILRYLSAGTSVSASVSRAVGVPTGESVLSLGTEQNFKPSEIVGIDGMSKDRVLEIKAKQKEDVTTLTIPPGAWIEAIEPVTSVLTLDVSGGFRVPAGSFNDLTSVTVDGALDAAGNAFPKLTSLTVSGELYAPSATGDPTGGIVINVGNGGTVELGSIAKLNTGSTVAAGGSLSADLPASSAGALVTAPGAKINGVETTGGGYETIDAITTFEAGKTYQLKAKASGENPHIITLSSATTLPAGATLVIPQGIVLLLSGPTTTFTVNGTVKAAGDVTLAAEAAKPTNPIAGTGMITVETTGTVATMPKISTQQVSETDLNPASANFTVSSTKNLATGRLDVKLYGTVTGGIPTSGVIDGMWHPAGNSKPGIGTDWSWVTFDDLLPALAANFVLKQTNQAFRYYKSTEETEELSEPVETAEGSVYVSADNRVAYKWRKYTSASPATEWWGILLWSGANPKTATIEVTPAANDGNAFTITVDWSGLRINNS
jgi:hypothetical protein